MPGAKLRLNALSHLHYRHEIIVLNGSMHAHCCSTLLRASVLRLPKVFAPVAAQSTTTHDPSRKPARRQASAVKSAGRLETARSKHVMYAQQADGAKQVRGVISVLLISTNSTSRMPAATPYSGAVTVS